MILATILVSIPFVAMFLFCRWRLNVAKRRHESCCHNKRLERAMKFNKMARDYLKSI